MKTESTEALKYADKELSDIKIVYSGATKDSKIFKHKDLVCVFEQGQSYPKIKQLEWKKSGGEYWEAITPIGAYSITLDFGIYEALYDMDNDVDGEWGSLAKAKAAAQADFEKRVRECLE